MSSTPAIARVTVQVCRFCGCTPKEPCRVPGDDECAFLDAEATRCSAPACVLAYQAEVEAAKLRKFLRLNTEQKLGRAQGELLRLLRRNKSRGGKRRAA
jgi:hypothetical protein